MSMPVMTRAQYDSGLDLIVDEYEREYGSNLYLAPVAALLNESLNRYKASAVIVESAPAGSPAQSASATGATASRSRRAPKAPKPGKKRRRITKAAVRALNAHAHSGPRETVTTAAGPSLPLGVALPAKPARAKAAPTRPLHELDGDQLAAATVTGVAGDSPFWRPRESAPAAPVTESAADARQLAADLATLSDAELARVFDAQARQAGHRSPIWAA